MAKWMIGATGVVVIAATVVAVVLIERGTSVPRPPATTGAPTGEDPAAGQKTGPITEQTPPRSVREGGADKSRAQEAEAVTGRSNEHDAPPAPSDAAQEETPVLPGSLPPELEELRGEPALERQLERASRLSAPIPPAQDRLGINRLAALVPAGSERLTRVLIADDELMRAGLVEFLSGDPGIEIVGQAPTGREAVERARHGREPDPPPQLVLAR